MANKKTNFKECVNESIELIEIALNQEIHMNYEGEPNDWHKEIRSEIKNIKTLLKIY